MGDFHPAAVSTGAGVASSAGFSSAAGVSSTTFVSAACSSVCADPFASTSLDLTSSTLSSAFTSVDEADASAGFLLFLNKFHLNSLLNDLLLSFDFFFGFSSLAASSTFFTSSLAASSTVCTPSAAGASSL